MQRSGVLSTTQFAYRKGLGICDALLRVSHTLDSAFESEQGAKIVQINFSEAIDMGQPPGNSLQALLCGIGDSVLSILP